MTESVNFTIGTDEFNLISTRTAIHSMANRHDGDDPTRMIIHDGSGALTIGDAGLASSTEQSEFGQLQLLNRLGRLDSALAVRGIRYQGKPMTAPTAAADGDAQQIGFVGQEVAAACPAATPGGKP